jgi:hypothetical protein
MHESTARLVHARGMINHSVHWAISAQPLTVIRHVLLLNLNLHLSRSLAACGRDLKKKKAPEQAEEVYTCMCVGARGRVGARGGNHRGLRLLPFS